MAIFFIFLVFQFPNVFPCVLCHCWLVSWDMAANQYPTRRKRNCCCSDGYVYMYFNQSWEM